MTSNSPTLVKCPPKDTGLCLAKYSKSPYRTMQKGPILVWTKFSKRFIRLDMDSRSVGGEEFQRAGTEKMHSVAVHSGLHPPLSVHFWKGAAHMIQKWPVSFDLFWVYNNFNIKHKIDIESRSHWEKSNICLKKKFVQRVSPKKKFLHKQWASPPPLMTITN